MGIYTATSMDMEGDILDSLIISLEGFEHSYYHINKGVRGPEAQVSLVDKPRIPNRPVT